MSQRLRRPRRCAGFVAGSGTLQVADLAEATSALDSEVEAAIHDTLDQVMEGRTVITIAHRLSTIARMDRIVVLDAGRIVEEGTHGPAHAWRSLRRAVGPTVWRLPRCRARQGA